MGGLPRGGGSKAVGLKQNSVVPAYETQKGRGDPCRHDAAERNGCTLANGKGEKLEVH